jgi:uncharacterized protein YdeI (YjbR/CyaY-like superfamily)
MPTAKNNRTMEKGLLYIKKRKSWRKWLSVNHGVKKEAWLLFYKKYTGKPSLLLPEAVEEALCYGWIDGKLKSIDKEKHMIRFTPRRKGSVWSDINKARIKKLKKAGKMTAAGLKTLIGVDLDSKEFKISSVALSEPADLKAALKKDKMALINWNVWPPSLKKMGIWWVKDSKKAETRERRIKRIVERAGKNIKYLM